MKPSPPTRTGSPPSRARAVPLPTLYRRFLQSILAFFSFGVLLSQPSAAGSTDQSRDTFAIVITPKIISDFNDPLPSIRVFYDNYEQLMRTFNTKIVVFAVGSGDHIFQYPSNISPPVQSRTVFADADIGPWSSVSNAHISLDQSDTFSGAGSYRVTATSNGGQAVKTGFPNIPLKDFPLAKWAWKKQGGERIILQFLVTTKQAGHLPGIFTGQTWKLRNSVGGGPADVIIGYGQPGDIPVVGDWDGDGRATIGVFRNGTWILTNDNGSTLFAVGYGQPGDIPVVGDWDGDGKDTIGVFRNGTWILTNDNGSTLFAVGYGQPGDIPVVGDWDGDGKDDIGVFRHGIWILTNNFGVTSFSFAFGNATDTPVIGDWNSDGTDTVGVVRKEGSNLHWFIRNSNSTGIGEFDFIYGAADDLPVAGGWKQPLGAWIGYVAGQQVIPGLGNWDSFVVSNTVPPSWTEVEVNLYQDAYRFFTKEQTSHEFEQRSWMVTGLALTPYDGTGWYDNIQFLSEGGVNWARHSYGLPPESNAQFLNQAGRAYPQALTYTHIRAIVAAFHAEAQRRGFTVKVLDALEPSVEFSVQYWKYRRHKESLYTRGFGNLDITKSLAADSYHYAAYPNGLPQGTSVSAFVVNQTAKYVHDLGFDGIYLFNAFGTNGQWVPAFAPGFSEAEAQAILQFFRNLKTALGPQRIVMWMDSYYPVRLEHDAYSVPEEAYQYMDIIQISTFWQDANGNPIIFWTPEGQYATMRETIESKLALRQRLPNLKLLWTFYYADPWYPVGYGESTSLSGWNQYKAGLSGITLYSNNYKGEHIPQAWLQNLMPSVP